MPMPSSRAAKTHGTLPERSRRARHGNVRHAQGLARTGVREPRGLFLRTSPRAPHGARCSNAQDGGAPGGGGPAAPNQREDVHPGRISPRMRPTHPPQICAQRAPGGRDRTLLGGLRAAAEARTLAAGAGEGDGDISAAQMPQARRPAPISSHGPSSLAPRLGARARRGSRRGPPAAAARASAGGLWQPVQGRGVHVESCHGAAWPGARGAQPTGRHQSGTHFSPNAPHTHPQNPSPAGSRRPRRDTFGWAARRRAARKAPVVGGRK